MSNFNICPKSNTSQLNRINIKYNTNNPNTNINMTNNTNINNNNQNSKKQVAQNKLIVIKNENCSFRPGSKNNSRQMQFKNRPGFQYKNLKRNNKSYAYKESKIINKDFGSRKNTINRKDIIDVIAIAQKHNKSFNEEDNFHELNRYSLKSNSVSNRAQNINEDEGRFITFEEMPHVKKRELNFLLNERNKKRQKFLDKINAGNKDLL